MKKSTKKVPKSQPKLTSFFTIKPDKKKTTATAENTTDKENVKPLNNDEAATPNRLSQKIKTKLKVSDEAAENSKRKEPEPEPEAEIAEKSDSPVKESNEPKQKRRKVIAFSDSEDEADTKNVPFSKKQESDDDDDFKPDANTESDDDMEFDDDDDFIVEDSSDEVEETHTKSKKSKSLTTPVKSKTSFKQETTPIRSISPNTSALSQFRRATPSPNPLSPNQKSRNTSGNNKKEHTIKYFHETLRFLQPQHIKDKNKNRPDHPDYDPSTLFIPPNAIDKKVPPMTHQFFKLKEDHFDTVFMFKVGKFYEFYHTDAQLAINVLGLKKQNGDNLKCGFPEMACDRYMRALVEAGYKVARVEQTETADELTERKRRKDSKYHWDTKTTNREICSIATAGTVSSANAFDFDETNMGKAKNYFFSIYMPEDNSNRIGIVALHSGRGEWFMTFIENDDRYHSKMLSVLSQFKISQVIFPKRTTKTRNKVFDRLQASGNFIEKRVEKHFWKPETLLKFLTKINASWKDSDTLFKSYFNGCGAEVNSESGGDVILPAFGALCQYFEECKLSHVVLTRPLLKRLESHKSDNKNTNQKMVIDAISQKNLDLDNLFKRINYTKTDFGKRLLYDWMQAPIMNIDIIKKRQASIKFLIENPDFRKNIVDNLLSYDKKKMPDIPTLLQRLKCLSKENLPKDHPNNRAQIYEIVRYSKNQLTNFCKLLCIFEQIWESIEILQKEIDSMPDMLAELLKINEDVEKQNHHYQFPNLTKEMAVWNKKFDRTAAKQTGKIVPKRKNDLVYDKLLTAVEEKQQNLNNFADEVAEEFGMKRNLISFESKPKNPHMFVFDGRYESDLVNAGWKIINTKKATKKKNKQLIMTRNEDQIEYASDLASAENELEEYIRNQNNIIFIQWIESADKWLQAIDSLKIVDCLVSLSFYMESESESMVFPEFLESKEEGQSVLKLKQSRHPCIKLPVGQSFVPNSVDFDRKVMILTGPNMGGKSTIMRQVALNIVLGQMGSYVPAESMIFTPVDRIFTRIGGSDHMIKGESTFYVELNETASILQHATLNSFVIIDELGRGTATHDGCAIARAVYQELVEMNVMSIVSTHYHSLVDELQKNKVNNLQLAYMQCYEEICEKTGKVLDVNCLFELAEGVCPQSHGFACARKAYIDEKVIEKGQRYANELEDVTKLLTKITEIFS